jgi:hypothetical protein
MNPETLTVIGSIFLGTIGAFFGFMRYIINKFLKELRPNGGTSLKDQINRLELNYEKLQNRIDEVYDHLLTIKTTKPRKNNESN